jgi:PAS domain S-box-containing protein
VTRPDYSQPTGLERLFEVLDRLGVGYYRSDLEGRIVALNRVGAAMFGCEPEEMIGKPTVDFNVSREEWARLRRQVFEFGTASSFVGLTPRRDGSTFYMESSLQLLLDGQGFPLGIEGVFRDVTREVELARQQGELVSSLRRSNQALAQLSSLQEQILSSLAHDLKTPPVVMQGFAELLLRGRYGVLEPGFEKPLRTILRNVVGLVDMVESVLTFSRLLRSLPDQRGAVSLGRAWFEAMAELASRSPESAARFVFDAGPGEDEVEASTAALAHMVSHFVRNALALAAPGTAFSCGIAKEGDTLRLQVTLPALDAERPSLSRLMDSFFWEVPGGEGEPGTRLLALGAVKYLAAVLGGGLKAEPLDEGATLTLVLPKARPR